MTGTTALTPSDAKCLITARAHIALVDLEHLAAEVTGGRR